MGAVPNQVPTSATTPYTALLFVIQQQLLKLAGPTLVQVVACTNDGELSPVGFVDVMPLVNQVNGANEATPHATVYGLPYLRIQGGTDAVIIDPKPGDIGLACFASRDISSVKASKAQANPGSARTYDWADGLYLGGMLNGAPTQYVRFSSAGVEIISPTKITLTAPIINISGGGTSIDGKVFLTHDHTGVSTGGGNTGPVG